jgi:hypothetical protein
MVVVTCYLKIRSVKEKKVFGSNILGGDCKDISLEDVYAELLLRIALVILS